MRGHGAGAIVNVSSIAGRAYGTPFTSAYAATKHALCSVSDSLHAETADLGVRVACIEPGFFATSVVDNADFIDPTGSPYEAMATAVEAFYRQSMAAAPPPQPVIDAILGAADGTLSPDTIHHPVGEGAEMTVVGMQAMTYAEFVDFRRGMLGT